MADAEKKGCCQKFGDGLTGFFAFLYNKEAGLVMGRDGESWAKIGFFYLIFYGFLAGFFSGMLAIFLTTIETPGQGGPKLIQYLENQPGLNRLDNQDKLEFGYYDKKNKDAVITKYANFVNDFLNLYQKGWDNNNKSCSASGGEEGNPIGKPPCYFDRSMLGNCSGLTDTTYGLNSTMPCFFVKINKIYGWVPRSNTDNGFLKLRCKEKFGVVVSPEGFLINAFPFRGQKPFELPVVAVQVDVKKHKSVSCWLEGKGIKVSPSYVPSRAYGNIRIKDDK